MKPVFIPSGDRALTMKLGEVIDPDINARIITFAQQLMARPINGITDIVPTYCALLVCYDPARIRGQTLERLLKTLWKQTDHNMEDERVWDVPCLYGGEVGQDLDELARIKNLSPEKLIRLHSQAEYRVYMIGFAPGFAYLGGLPQVLHTSRLKVPRQNIPQGAVGIGGQQANINSVAGPSGWRYIGWTPWQSFDPTRETPFLFQAGDRIRFHPVSAEEAAEISSKLHSGDLIPKPQKGIKVCV